MSVVSGDLRTPLTEVDLDVLTDDNGAAACIAAVEREYQWTLGRLLPRKLEAALYEPSNP
eukprot:2948592-Amphidinium_carterae.1